MHVDNDLGIWAQQLVDGQEDDGCLRQPPRQPEGVPPELRDSLYIRPCYRRLYNLLWTSCSKEKKHPLGFVVTGTPGIGKSAFALYLIKQLGSRQQIVYYEYQEARAWRRIKFDFSGPQAVATSTMTSVRDGEHRQLHMWKCICYVEGVHDTSFLLRPQIAL